MRDRESTLRELASFTAMALITLIATMSFVWWLIHLV